MKVCLFSDIHGNKYALNLLLKTDDFKTADKKICLGDVIIGAPYPNECCKFLLDNNCVWVLGNHDSYVANGMPKHMHKKFCNAKINHQIYMRNKLEQKYKDYIKTLPKEYSFVVNNKKFYFTHYPWQYDNVVEEPKKVSLKATQKLFKDVDASYIFYGHEHRVLYFKDKNKKYVCTGSLGFMYPGDYFVLDIKDNGTFTITHKLVYYNILKLKQEMLKINYPYAKRYVHVIEYYSSKKRNREEGVIKDF